MQAAKTRRRQAITVFWIVLILEAAYGIYLSYGQGLLLGDAVSRTANAFYVLNVKPYRYASMGLVWNPLPSTLQLPFIALAKLWRPIASEGIGAAIVTAFFAGWSAKIIYETCLEFELSKSFTVIYTLLVAFHPYLFFYGANGMSEAMSFSFTIRVMASLTLWIHDGSTRHLVRVALGNVGLFFTRYESIPFAIAVALCISLFIMVSRREQLFCNQGKASERYFYIEGTLILVFTPMAYAVLMWIFYNWIITGNPLYFLNSGYSMLAYSAYYSSHGGLLEVLAFLMARTWPFLIPVGVILLLRLFTGRLFRWDTLYFLACALVLTAFQFYMLLQGTSAGYVRYMCYPLIICVAWIPYEIRASGIRLRKFMQTALALTLLVSGVWFGWALQQDEIFREDTLLMLPEGSQQMADYINSNLSDRTILMDAYRAYDVYLHLDDVDTVKISSSLDFYQILEDPVVNGIQYILVPESSSYGDMDAVNIAYPKLYNEGVAWAQEVVHIGEFKLFKVLGA
ncbi:MAG TPA: dolichyl-phosphate-mannose--protein mannosyltransferase [Candidatus Limiplasma sp.]|nr:dolichyl-phosphate-mannose--protein mannosyltransferase [Candidatus Limiplasma sp.]HPS80870.1 dolichyl-phosphate-mannose--protein mannosyltransferase [Candidatus Limiplasma sp.]